MRKFRMIFMILTGALLAVIIWFTVLYNQSRPNTQEEKPSNQDTTTAVLAEYSISPATVQSGRSDKDQITIAGLGMAGTQIEFVDGETSLTSASVDEDGRWLATFNFAADKDTLLMNIYMRLEDDKRVRSDQEIVLVRDTQALAGEATRPHLILLTAPGSRSSVLQSLYGGFAGREGFYLDAIDYDNSGGVIFSGQSIHKGKVRIFVRNTLEGESSVDNYNRWNLIFGNILPMGEYRISAELIPDDGGEPIRIQLPFNRLAPIASEADSPPVTVKWSPERVQIARAIMGGGYQFTVIYPPEETTP